jgi:DNA-binding response OmpR family regulator
MFGSEQSVTNEEFVPSLAGLEAGADYYMSKETSNTRIIGRLRAAQ